MAYIGLKTCRAEIAGYLIRERSSQMALIEFFKFLFTGQPSSREFIELYEKIYLQARKLHQDWNPHNLLTLTYISKLKIQGLINAQNEQEAWNAASNETFICACIPYPDCARALGLHMLYKQRPWLADHKDKFRKEYEELFGPVLKAQEDGTINSLYLKLNPGCSANGLKELNKNKAEDPQDPTDQQIEEFSINCIIGTAVGTAKSIYEQYEITDVAKQWEISDNLVFLCLHLSGMVSFEKAQPREIAGNFFDKIIIATANNYYKHFAKALNIQYSEIEYRSYFRSRLHDYIRPYPAIDDWQKQLWAISSDFASVIGHKEDVITVSKLSAKIAYMQKVISNDKFWDILSYYNGSDR